MEKELTGNTEISVAKNHPVPFCGELPVEAPGRLKFWEIARFLKCPVIGMCLSFYEQKRILKRSGISFKHRSHFEIHELLVAGADVETGVSRQVDRLLNRKFRPEIAPLMKLSEKVFMGYWASSFYSGEFTGALWAAAIKPDLTEKSRFEIFGAIHMSMHQNGEREAQLKKRLAFQEKETVKMTAKAREMGRALKKLQRAHVALQATNDDLNMRVMASETERERLTAEFESSRSPSAVVSLEREKRRLNSYLKDLGNRIREAERTINETKSRNRQLKRSLSKQVKRVVSLEEEAARFFRESSQLGKCDASCPSYDLCQKRILLVGGLTRMTALYREVIEGRNGVFEYHDGYMRKGAKMLENRIRRADMVICPVTCNSHAACSLVKSLGKKHKKPVRLLNSASLTALAQAIADKGNVCFSNN